MSNWVYHRVSAKYQVNCVWILLIFYPLAQCIASQACFSNFCCKSKETVLVEVLIYFCCVLILKCLVCLYSVNTFRPTGLLYIWPAYDPTSVLWDQLWKLVSLHTYCYSLLLTFAQTNKISSMSVVLFPPLKSSLITLKLFWNLSTWWFKAGLSSSNNKHTL